jgi:hypothetical protein
MRSELDASAQSNPMWSSNCSFRGKDSSPVCTLTLLRLRRNVQESLTSFPNDQIWTRSQSVIGSWSCVLIALTFAGDGSFLQAGAADVMTWYRLGEADCGDWKCAVSFSLSSRIDDPCRASHSHTDLGYYTILISLEHSTSKDRGEISCRAVQHWRKEKKHNTSTEKIHRSNIS